MRQGIVLAATAAWSLAIGCGGASGPKSKSSATAPASTQLGAPVAAPQCTALTVMRAGSTPSSLYFVFSVSVDLATLREGVTWGAYEDQDTTPGGTYRALSGTFAFDYTRCNATFTPARGFTSGREVRFFMTSGVVSAQGMPLVWSSQSAPLSLSHVFPGETFEARCRPGGGATTPPPSTPPPSTPPPSTPPPSTPPPSTPPPSTPPTAPGFGGDPTTFKIDPATDPWHLDFDVRAAAFLRDMSYRGLASGDPATDRLAKGWIVAGTLAFASTRYNRAADGTARPGAWRISFTSVRPAGTPGVHYSREGIGGYGPNQWILGMSFMDYGNRIREDNGQPGMGVFTAVVEGNDSRLSPSLRATDRGYLDGSYSLGAGSAAQDARMRRIHAVIANWSRAIAHTTAHEVGHSVGLDHVSGGYSIMTPGASPDHASNPQQYFYPSNASVLDRNLGKH